MREGGKEAISANFKERRLRLHIIVTFFAKNLALSVLTTINRNLWLYSFPTNWTQ